MLQEWTAFFEQQDHIQVYAENSAEAKMVADCLCEDDDRVVGVYPDNGYEEDYQ